MNEVDELKARIETLEHLLEVHETVAAQQNRKLESARAEALARAEEARRSEEVARRQASILDLVIRSMVDGVVVVDQAGKLLLRNPASEPFLPTDGASFGTSSEHPLARALRGEAVDEEISVKSAALPDGADVSITANPMRDADGLASGAVAVFRDVTERRRLVEVVEARNRELETNEQARSELVERLRISVDELSTPILEVWDDVLALPIIGLVDARRAAQIMERLLEQIARKEAGYVIIDVTGVAVIDSNTAEHFSRLVRAVELMGARCVLTGVRPAVGKTMIDLGLELGSVRTLRNLKHALRSVVRLVDHATDGRPDPATLRPGDA